MGETPQPDRVQVADPGGDPRAPLRGGVRAAGSRRASSPRGASPEPFLLGRGPPRDRHRQRPACCRCARTGSTASATCSTSARSRAERLLVLSSRSSDEEGNPQTESFFVDDVRELLAGRRRAAARARCPRSPGDPRTRPPRRSGTARTRPPARAAPVPQRRPAQLRAAARASCPRRDAVSARALENFADCPVKWLVRGPAEAATSSCPTPRRWCAARTPTRCSSRTYERAARGDRRAAA